MRLSFHKQHEIREKIIKDLYDAPKRKIDDKKGGLVLRNHSEWIKPLMPLINQLPDNITCTSDQIKMTVPELTDMARELSNISTAEESWDNTCAEATWTQYSDAKLPVMTKGTGWNSEDLPIPLQDGLREEVVALRLEEFQIQQEKKQMEKYLLTTMEINNTTTKLRKAFPSTLQKYIPPEPPRKPKQTRLPIDLPDEVDVPSNLKLRMTENLLDN